MDNSKYKEINLDVFCGISKSLFNLVAIIQEGKTTEQDLLNFRIVSLSSFYFFILVRQEIKSITSCTV
jgi:hypothetical protein